jgi:hypothetical protein
MEILKEIKKIVDSEGIKISVLAKQAEITPSDKIYKWFDGRGNPKPDDYEKLKKWLESKNEQPTSRDSTLGTIQDDITVLEDDVAMLMKEIIQVRNRLDALEKSNKK